ncbi:MAG: deoxynucleoside kinase [Acidobacteriota bacterium]
MKFKQIAVEGPIGVGKTSLVERLAEKFNARKVVESIENPFLKDFYNDKTGAAFQTQLFFLLNRYRQLSELKQADLFQQLIICDYLFAKDKIFAYLNLNDSELMLYEKLYGMLEVNVPMPDLVIYLQAETSVLYERIKGRKRDYEKEISEEYINEVNKAYNYFFFHYDASPLLVINTSDIDFVHQPEDLDDLVMRIRNMGKGVQYYVPLGSKG